MSYIKGVISELKQVSWLTAKDTVKMSGIVLTVLIVSTVLVWGIDIGLSSGLAWLLGK